MLRDRLLKTLAVGLFLGANTLQAQLAPPTSGGMVQFDRLLLQLSENRRVLMVGAHPDDEDSDFLAYSARGVGARTAYLSLTRGEGGQNLIGQELGDALGLLRTEELVAARSVDGAEQFFSRAYDFGFTRSLDETFSFWHPDSLLKDAVRVIRRFKPDIVVAVFSGTPRDGHGQHQASAVIARRAYENAGSDSVFPELATEEGLDPWQPTTMFFATRSRVDNASVVLSSGTTDPITGKSYHQIAMDGRSQHRSQDMGRLQQAGPRRTGLLFLDSKGEEPDQGDMFAGVLKNSDWLAAFADSLRRSVGPAGVSDAVPALALAVERAQADGTDRYRGNLLESAFLTAARVVVDATSSRESLVPGTAFEVALTVFNDGQFPVTVSSVGFDMLEGWTYVRREISTDSVAPGEQVEILFDLTVPPDAPISQAYFLEDPRDGFLYDWSNVRPLLRGTPRQPPLVSAHVQLEVLGTTASATREVSYRYRDQAIGEIRRELEVVPRIDIKMDRPMSLWPLGRSGGPVFTVTLVNNDSSAVAGNLELRSRGQRVAPARRFEFENAGDSETFVLEIDAPTAEGDFLIEAVAVTDRADYGAGVTVIEYSHIRPARIVARAQTMIRATELRMPEGVNVGYVRGAADRVPEALTEIGMHVTVLTDEQLEAGDLSQFEVIVIGSRAYETNDVLARANARLLEFARAGGRLIVQYQQYQFVDGGFAPYELTISRPHDRITNENAPVELIDPASPAFRFPNSIEDADWDGWPQERGLYFAHEWADEYRPLLRMSDPDGPSLEGGLLVAEYGEGTYLYTGISFFRALPAGVPGAFRLFLNLVGLDAGAIP